MQQEVFGPVLPILNVNDLDEAITFINKQEKALCVYAYSSNRKVYTTKTQWSICKPGGVDVFSDHVFA